MIINSKFAYVKKKETFEPLITTIPKGLNPIVFIEDTREMWTCGTYFSIGYPSIEISESSGSVKVSIGNSFFLLSTAGESISVRKGDGNRIIISSNALNRVDTEAPLTWDTANRKLLHMDSGVAPGSYGQSTNLGNASVFIVPNIMIDNTGHITYAQNYNVEIRDYVEQLAPSTLAGNRNVLLSYNADSESMDTSQVRKANGLLFNDSTQRLTVEGGLDTNGPVFVNHGDLSVLDGYIIGHLKGDVEGEAKPKIHLSNKPEYGGASINLYGHVKLQDILNNKPEPSSDNENINDANVVNAIAASPLMVWNAIQTAKDYADSILGSNNAMLYKGSIEAGITYPGTYTPIGQIGNTYVVTFGSGNYIDSVGYVNGEPVEVGDLIICKEETPAATSTTWETVKSKWTYVQTNNTGVVSGPSSSTIGQLAVFNNTKGKLIKGLPNGNVGQILSIDESGIPAWVNKPDRLNFALSFQVRGTEFIAFDGYEPKKINFIAGDNMFITSDMQGNLTLAADPGSDTVNTAGATNKVDTKLFLIGAESQTTAPQTYSNQYVYIGTDNCLYSLGKKVLTEHQAIYNLDLQTQVGEAVTKVTTFDPNAANNSFTLVQGTNVTLTPDAANKKVTISSKDTTYDFYNLVFKQGESVIDTYKPTTSPSKTLKAGTNVTFTGSNNEVLITTQDTRNTAGATEKLTTKLFLTGALTQTDNPQTYTNSKVYIGADNKLYSDGKVVSTGDHTHNYAGATSPGGPALKVDLNPSGLLDATYGSYGGILQDSNKGPVSGSWSNRIKILHNNSTGYYTELAQNFTGTAGLWHRRNVAGTVSEWTPVIDNANFHTYLDSTYVIRGNDPNVLTNYVRYSKASGLTMNWEWGNATPTHIWGAKASDSSKAYVFNGDNIRAFANAVNRAGDTMTGTLKVTEIQATNGNGLVMWNGTTYTYLGMQAGTTYIRSGETDLQHRYNGTDYKIWDARNLVGLRTEHSHNTINFIDSRKTASTPQEHAAGVWLDFKANAKANLSDGGNYTGLLTVRKYGGTTDWSGGKSAQLGFTDNSNVWVRFGSGASWEAWKQLATTGWANGKFLPLAGGTVTGNIILKGSTNADMTNANIHPRLRFDSSDSSQTVSFIFTDYDSYRAPAGIKLVGNQGNEWFEAPKLIKTGSSDSYVLLGGGGHTTLSGLYTSHNHFERNTGIDPNSIVKGPRTYESTSTANRPDTNTWHQYTTLGTGDSNYCHQLSYAYAGGTNIYHRVKNGGSWGSWLTILDSGNYAGMLDNRYRKVGGTWKASTCPGTREFGFVSNNGPGEVSFSYDTARGGVLNMSIDGDIYCNDAGHKVWHAGNDGSGSGLDADLLDGWQLASITERWTSVITLGQWSRLLRAVNHQLGGSFILNVHYTRNNVVVNNVFLITFGHSNSAHIVTLGTHNYTQIQLRLTDGGSVNDVYVELLGSGSGTQTVYCQIFNMYVSSITKYTSYTAGGGTVRASTSTVNGRLKVDNNTVAFTSDNVASATNADTVDGQHASAFSYKSWWHWSGQSGQPSWIWGGNSENNYYVYNPANFNVNYANSAGTSSIAHKLDITGYQSSGLSFYQTSSAFDGSPANWAHYIIANHGDGASDYHYTIRLPFWGTPQYKRQTGSTSNTSAWYKFWTSENFNPDTKFNTSGGTISGTVTINNTLSVSKIKATSTYSSNYVFCADGSIRNFHALFSTNILWASYKVNTGGSGSYSRLSGNYSFITGRTREGTGRLIVTISVPSGYSQTQIMMFATGHHVGPVWTFPVYASIQPDYGTGSSVRIMTADDNTLNDAECIVNFILVKTS